MDLVMPPQPFSTVFVPRSGSTVLQIPEEMRNEGLGSPVTAIELPAGVVQVIVTWKGVDPISIRHYVGNTTTFEPVATIPASSTVKDRSTGVMTFASDKRHAIVLLNANGSDWNANTLSKGYVVGMQVIPMGTNADITGGGSLLRVDDSVGTRVLLGDQMIYGDTGWRMVPTNPDDHVSGFLQLRRVGSQVTAWLTSYVLEPGRGYGFLFNAGTPLPYGYRTVSNDRTMGYIGLANNAVLGQRLSAYGTSLTWVGDLHSEGGTRPTQPLQGTFSWYTDDRWPTSLPGTPR